MDFKNSNISDCKIITLPKIHNTQGNITAIENLNDVPFNVQRLYYLYDVPSSEGRGGHAHYELEQFIVAVSGSFDIILKDGINERIVSLNRPNNALHVVPGLWREIANFSGGSICLVLASEKYDENDYIRDYNKYLDLKHDS